jgi:G3E family GTPase
VVGAIGGRIDPTLLYDVASAQDRFGQLSFRDVLFDTATDAEAGEDVHHHVHADAVTVTTEGPVDPLALVDLLEDPPPGVYRMKGTVAVRQRSSTRAFVVNVVGSAVHVARASARAPANCLVAIGMHLDTDAVQARLTSALRPTTAPPSPAATRRLQRHLRG